MRKSAPINIVIHGPSSAEGQKELARRVAKVHAQAVEGAVSKQRCSVKEKIVLLQAVADTTRQQKKEDTIEL